MNDASAHTVGDDHVCSVVVFLRRCAGQLGPVLAFQFLKVIGIFLITARRVRALRCQISVLPVFELHLVALEPGQRVLGFQRALEVLQPGHGVGGFPKAASDLLQPGPDICAERAGRCPHIDALLKIGTQRNLPFAIDWNPHQNAPDFLPVSYALAPPPRSVPAAFRYPPVRAEDAAARSTPAWPR